MKGFKKGDRVRFVKPEQWAEAPDFKIPKFGTVTATQTTRSNAYRTVRVLIDGSRSKVGKGSYWHEDFWELV